MSKRAIIILIISALLIFGWFGAIALGMILCEGSYTLRSTADYTIEPGEKEIISEKLGRNEGWFITVTVTDDRTVTLATDELRDIGISVVGPNDQVVVPLTIAESGTFSVLAEESGKYVITLDNSHSLTTTKTVTLVKTYRYPEKTERRLP
jgi:hypothetical protein